MTDKSPAEATSSEKRSTGAASPPDLGNSSGRKLAISFTFDFDAESAWLGSFGVSTPSALSRGAYGANEGVPRILALLRNYELPATFFIPGDSADRHPDVTKTIVDAGHEIGHHGYLHEPPHRLDLAAEREMIERGLQALDRAGVRPVGYRSPSWELSDNTFDLLHEYGFKYDASQLAMDRPYWVSSNGQRTDLVEVPGAWELTDSSHFLFVYNPVYLVGLASPSKVEEILERRLRRALLGRFRRLLCPDHAPSDHWAPPSDENGRTGAPPCPRPRWHLGNPNAVDRRGVP